MIEKIESNESYQMEEIGLKGKKPIRKWSIFTLALGLFVGALPGVSAASGPAEFQQLYNQRAAFITEQSADTFISPEINTRSSKPVRVIVQLEGQPAAVGKLAAKAGLRSMAAEATEATVNREQAEFLGTVAEQGIELDVNYQYDTVLNGFEITIPADEIPQLAEIPGVKSIQENSTWHPVPIETASIESAGNFEINPIRQIGADQAWAEGLTGKGLKIGVIDTGVDYLHPDIAGAYKGGYDSFYNDPDPYEDFPISREEDPYKKGYAGTSHGTHVAGTIIGRAANTESEIVQKGIAYEAELYAYKVLGRSTDNPTETSGSSAQVIDGIERAVKDGMDVINLSLGSDSDKDVNSPDAIAINNAVLAGVVAVIANGNAGEDGYFSLGAPATSQLAISVGAVNSEFIHYEGTLAPEFVDSSAGPASTVTTATYVTYDFNVMAWETGNDDFKNILGSEPRDVVYADLGTDEDYDGLDVAGKVVLVSRGVLSFVEKVLIAKEHGAFAIAIFNGTEKGDDADLSETISGYNGHIGTSLGDTLDFIPTFDLRGVDGRAMARAVLANPDLTLEFTFGEDYLSRTIPGDYLAGFSSWGPNVDADLSIKPDIVAPGVNIMSSYPEYGDAPYDKAYIRSSGTSMASPHIAGLALLLLQKHPDWTPFDIRAALANTADVLEDEDSPLYEVYEQGAGRADVAEAIKTPALLQAVEPITILDPNYNEKNVTNYNSSASFGVAAPGTGALNKILQLKNTSGEAVTYQADVDWHFDHEGVNASLDVASVAAEAGTASTFQLSLTIDPDVEEGFYEGQVNLTSSGLPTLHLPFVVYVGEEQPDNGFGIQEVQLTHSVVYPNRSTQKSTDLSFRLTAKDTNLYEIDVYNLDDEWIGILDQQQTEKVSDRFAPGVYSLKGISNAYYPIDPETGGLIVNNQGEPITRNLTDGVYKIRIVVPKVDENNEWVTEGGFIVAYIAYTSYRVDNSTGSSGDGNGSGGGGGGGGSAGGSSGTAAAPTESVQLSGSAGAVIEEGYKTVTLGAKTSTADGVTTATISDSDLSAALASAGTSSPEAIVVSLPADGGTSTQASFTAGQVQQLAALHPQSVIVFDASGSAFSLPIALLEQAPASAGLILEISEAEAQKSAFAAKSPSATILGTPVAFEANWATETGSTPLQVPFGTFIKRAFTVPGQIQPNTAGVLYEENGTVSPVASVFKPQQNGSTLVTVSRPGFSVYAAVSRTVQFEDIADSPAASHITALANKFIIEGTSAGKFSPKSNLTRAEFTSLLVRALGLKAESSAAKFTDVEASDWFAGDIAAAYEAGLIQGKSETAFAPRANVTRQELTVILARVLELTGAELNPADAANGSFVDDSQIAAYAKESVKAVTAAGIISGETTDGDTYFRPNAASTRESAAAALHLLLSQTGLSD